MKKLLIVISINFAKAFNSIKRDVMIKLLMEYKVNHKVIGIIAKLYEGDKTIIKLDEEEELEIAVNSGIRQG